MGVTVSLSHNNQDPRRVPKVIAAGAQKTAELKRPTDIINPIFIMDYDEIIQNANYIIMNEGGEEYPNRYYFITSYVLAPGGKMEVHCHEDVLATYAGAILNSYGVIERTEDYQGQNAYLADPEAKPYQYTESWTHEFPYSFNPFGHIYLSTVG